MRLVAFATNEHRGGLSDLTALVRPDEFIAELAWATSRLAATGPNMIFINSVRTANLDAPTAAYLFYSCF